MRFERGTTQRRRRLMTAGKGMGVHEYLNLFLWALVFIATSIITLDTNDFNYIAPFMAFGMVASTMLVHQARGKR
ncbi:hypothetical protein ACFL5M_05545 [Candidatus Neomarinimicrobiota bacterium]